MIGIIFAIVPFIPLFNRSIVALLETPHASHDTFSQQYQLARFISYYYNNAAIAINDIGAVHYYTNCRGFDVWGLSTADIMRAKLERRYTTELVEELVEKRGIELAAIHDRGGKFFHASVDVPSRWKKVGEWRVTGYTVPGLLGEAAVGFYFYAINPAVAGELRENLRTFAPHLPPNVTSLLIGQ